MDEGRFLKRFILSQNDKYSDGQNHFIKNWVIVVPNEDFEGAIRAFESAVALDPFNAVTCSIGQIYDKINMHWKAIEWFHKSFLSNLIANYKFSYGRFV